MTYSPVTIESLLSHQHWALRVARRLVREEDAAEDLVQRTWMAALRCPPQSQIGAKAWIRKVILNLARERHRRDQARVRHEGGRSPSEEGAGPADVFDSVSRAEIHRLLSERLMELAEPYRIVVLQRFYEDLTSVEIAQRLGIPAGTVRWRLKIGLEQLRDELDRRSQGDRTRWVSAFLAFSGPAETPSGAHPTAPAGPLASPTLLAWTALGAAGMLGLFLLSPHEWTSPEVLASADEGAPTPALPPRSRPDLRASGATQRVPAEALPTPERPELGAAQFTPEGLALLVLTPEGQPVPGASIHVARLDGHELRAHSDAQGRAWLVPQPGDVGALGLEVTRGRLSVRAIASGRAASELVHVAPPFTPEHRVHLNVGGPERILRGRVRTQEGRPVPGAVVAWFVPRSRLEVRPEGDFSSTSYLSVESDGNGEFVLANLSGTSEVLACFAPGFALFSRSCDTIDERALDIVLERGATIVGTIRRPGGSPAADVPVTLESICKTGEWATGLPGYDARRQGFSERTRTDEQGRFRLAGVCAGNRLRTVWAIDEERGLTASTTFRLANGAEVACDGELAQAPRLDLRLVDEHGRALAGQLVSARRQVAETWWARRVHADEHGRIRILDCPPGPILLDLFQSLGTGASLGWRLLYPSLEEETVVIDSRRLITLQGRLLDPFGAPEARGELVALSLDTNLETVLARSREGGFRQRMPRGSYLLLLRVGQTAGKLLEIKCRAGSERDVGNLTTPHLGNVLLEALPRGPDGPLAYSLYRISEVGDPDGSLLIGQGWIKDTLSLAMFPGRYRILLFHEKGPPADKRLFSVLPGQETRVRTWQP